MTDRIVVANALAYDFAPDDEPRLAERDWAIAAAQVVEDLTGDPISVPFRVRIVLPGPKREVAQDGTIVQRSERGIGVKLGTDGTFALVARPWLRFFPLAGAGSATVSVEAQGFESATHTFTFTYDQRTIAILAPAGSTVVTLDSDERLAPGQTLLLGPSTAPQDLRVRSIAGIQVTLAAALTNVQNVGNPVYPDVFSTPPPALIRVRRRAVAIVGRVVRRNTASGVTNPVVNASVTVTDFWRTAAAVRANPSNGAMTDPTPANRQFAVGLTPGVLVFRPAGTAVGPVSLPSATDDRLLTRPAPADEPRVSVNSRQNLLPGPAPLPNRLLLISATDSSTAEYHTISTIDPPGTAAEPANLVLEFPLVRDHEAGAVVARLNPGAFPVPGHALATAAERGDRCLFLDSPILTPSPQTLRISGGAAADEFQRFTPLSARSNAEGYFRLPPVQRMARIALTVNDWMGNVLPPIEIDPDYGAPEHQVDAVYLV